MKRTKRNRVLSLILCGALVFGQLGTTAYAEGGTNTNNRNGLCEHHTEHDEACGYIEGHPCEHQHTDECYEMVMKCLYIIDEDAIAENDASPSDAASPSNGEPVGHICSIESGCITKVLNCAHDKGIYDDTCGFVEAKPCQYECDICNPKDNDLINNSLAGNRLTEKTITGWEWLDPKGYLTDGGLALPGVNPNNQADFDTVVSMLPKKITAYTTESATGSNANEPQEITLTGWTCDTYKLDDGGAWPVLGDYTFTASLPEDYALSGEAASLEITVTLGGANTLENTVTKGAFILTSESGLTENTDYAYSDADHTLTIQSSTAVTISMANGAATITTDKIVVADDTTASITLNGVSIDVSATQNACAFEVAGSAVCNLTLTGTNTLKSGGNEAGLQVQSDARLTIAGNNNTGKLIAIGGYMGAGIGGGSGGNGGTITINGGTITTTGGDFAAGIGSGYYGAGGSVTINDGNVTVTGGVSGTIHITGGTVDSTNGGGGALSGEIFISGGTVTASGGKGRWDTGTGISGTATITGGTVKATHGENDGNGGNGISGTLIADSTGTAWIDVTGLNADTSGFASGVLLARDGVGKVGGSQTIDTDREIPSGATLVVSPGASLTINSGATLTNNGSFWNQGTITATGTLQNTGSLNNEGTISGTLTNSGGIIFGSGILPDGVSATITSNGMQTTLDLSQGSIVIGAASVSGKDTDGTDVITPDPDGYLITQNDAQQRDAETATANTITIASGKHNITLNGVNVVAGDNGAAFSIADSAICNLTLAENSTNTLTGGNEKAGLCVPRGAMLTIDGTGTLAAAGDYRSAGIGGNNGQGAGSITINEGTVTATGSEGAAAIGSGTDGSGGSITISGGTVTATGGAFGGCGIGGGGGSLTITGGVVTADSGSGIGVRCDTLTMNGTGFLSAKTNKADSTTVTSGFLLADGSATAAGTVTLPLDVTIASGKSLTVKEDATLMVPEGITLTVNGLVQNSGSITGSGTISGNGYLIGNAVSVENTSLTAAQEGDGTADVANGSVVLYEMGYSVGDTMYAYNVKTEGVTLQGETMQNSVTVAAHQTIPVTLNGVSIDVSGQNLCAFDMTGANVTLTLTGENELKSGSNCAGLQAPEGATLVMQGSGSLTADGGNTGAGIGGGNDNSGGTITISGGTVTASSSYGGAGIGGGSGGNGGTTTISGGTVTASSSYGGAGIGGGGDGNGGAITISGGTVTASSSYGGAGIGGGNLGSGGIITISGGMVTASSSSYGAGIGGGYQRLGGAITISGGTVTATSDVNSAGIGKGAYIYTFGGTFSTTKDGIAGGAVIIASSISDKSEPTDWDGVIFEGSGNGQVYGSPIITGEVEIPAEKTLEIADGKTLTVGADGMLNNRGTITVEAGGKLSVQTGGVFNNFSTLDGDGTKPGDYNSEKSTVKLEASSATYGKSLTLTATVEKDESQQASNAALLRGAPQKMVTFYRDGTEIGSSGVKEDNGVNTATLMIDNLNWKPGTYKLTASYTGGNSQLLPSMSSEVNLTVNKAEQTATMVSVSPTTVTYGDTAPVITPLTVEGSAEVTYSIVTSEDASGVTSDVASISGTTITLIKAGTFYVKAEIAATDYYEKKTVYSSAITVNALNSEFTATVKKGSEPTRSFTYGDTITVEVSDIQAARNRGNTIQQEYVYLFATDPGDTPDADKAIASTELRNGIATLTYDTTGKAITVGENKTLWIAYGGSGRLNPATKEVSVDLAAKMLTSAVDSTDSSAAKSYDGTAAFSNVKLTLTGVQSGDTVSATATGTAVDANAGEDKAFTVNSVTLDGTNKDWYSLAANAVSGNVKITKADGAAISTVTGSYTGDGSTFTYTISPISGAEYSTDNSTWQESNVFTGFTTSSPATTFYARMKEDNNHRVGASSNTGAVTFVKLDHAENPALSYQISGVTGSKKITIAAVSGCEYTFDGGANWGSNNVQTFSTDGKPTIGIRYVATATHNASTGAKQEVDLTNKEQAAPAAFVLGFTDNGDGTFTATIPPVTGGEYSFDGSNWSGTNTKTDCQPNTSYTGYVRLAAKDGYNASSATSDTKTTPGLIVADPVIKPNTSSDSSDSGSGQTGVNTPPKPDTPTTGTITIGKPDQNGSVSIPSEQVENAVNEAVEAAKKKGQTKNDIAIAANLPAGANRVTLDRAALDRLIASGVKSFRLNYEGVALSFDLPALKEIAGKTTGTLTFGAERAARLTGDALAAVGTRPAYNLTVSWQADGKTVYVDSFGAGSVSVAIAYTPAPNERTGGLYAVYVDDGGKVEWIDKSSYEQGSGTVIFQTGHFSTYGVGYKTPPAFTDTVNHWAKADIDFAVSRGLFSGTSADAFTPDDPMTRGMFVTALGRLAGINPADYVSSSRFTDVPATEYYAPYVEWAAGQGIVNGTGVNTFEPDRNVTSEQMAAIMQRYVTKLGYTLPVTREAENFTDAGQINGSMKDAVQAIQQAGIMSGKDGQRFGPQDTVTRAEAAAILRRYVEIMIAPDTAGL